MCRAILPTWLSLLVFSGALITPTHGAVERYKTEAAYLARLAELNLLTVTEGFESADWAGTRSSITLPMLQSPVVSKNLTWEAAGKDVFGSQYANYQHGLSTNGNWARSGNWGVYENHLGDPYPTTIRVSAITPIYGVGGWFNTNPDGQSVGFLFEDATTANEPGYVLPGYGAMYPGDNPSFGHEFIGFIDPAGFNSVVVTGTLEVNEEGVLEGGIIYGADDFTIGVSQDFFPPVTGDLDGDGFVGLADLDIILGDWNQSVPPGNPLADVSGPGGVPDGYIGLDDLDFVLANWNAGIPPVTTTSLPEPGACVIFAVGVAGALFGRRTRG